MSRLLVSYFVLVHITLDVVAQSVASQPDQVIISKPGDNVTVKCITPKGKSPYLFWYQQRMGQMLRIICVAQSNTDPQYYNEFKNSHFSIERMEGAFNLEIRNSTWSDEAMYYCGSKKPNGLIDFGNGTFVRIKDDTQMTNNTVAVIQSLTSDSTHPAHSEPLQCAAVRETGTEELSLFWFGPATRESPPGLISTYRNSSTCETRSLLGCMHEQATSNDSNAATCHCAVNKCGQMLFGNETPSQAERRELHSAAFLTESNTRKPPENRTLSAECVFRCPRLAMLNTHLKNIHHFFTITPKLSSHVKLNNNDKLLE
ncbi:uncharacterized protein LOC134095858 isoform X2 [Sardina pilchardus]|uniref:uncharacterized protein LOC134095858 isoform X2 n=1 Tax=Sardina pilchardus TaxID=27697 RepID=UPI002E0ED627